VQRGWRGRFICPLATHVCLSVLRVIAFVHGLCSVVVKLLRARLPTCVLPTAAFAAPVFNTHMHAHTHKRTHKHTAHQGRGQPSNPRSHIPVHTEVPVKPGMRSLPYGQPLSMIDHIIIIAIHQQVRLALRPAACLVPTAFLVRRQHTACGGVCVVAHGNAGRNKRIGKNCSRPWLVIRTTCRGTHGLLSHVVAEVTNSGWSALLVSTVMMVCGGSVVVVAVPPRRPPHAYMTTCFLHTACTYTIVVSMRVAGQSGGVMCASKSC